MTIRWVLSAQNILKTSESGLFVMKRGFMLFSDYAPIWVVPLDGLIPKVNTNAPVMVAGLLKRELILRDQRLDLWSV